MPIGRCMQMNQHVRPMSVHVGVATRSPKTDPVKFLRPVIRCSVIEDSCPCFISFGSFFLLVFAYIFGFLTHDGLFWLHTHKECFYTCGSSDLSSSALVSDGTRHRLSVPVCFWIQRRSQIPWNAEINVGHM